MRNKIVISFLSRILIAIVNFLLVVVLSQRLGSEGKGLCSQFIALLTFIQLFCDVIGGPSLVVLCKNFNNKQLYFLSVIWNLILSILISSFIYFLNVPSGKDLFLLILIAFLNAQVSSNQNILTGNEKYNSVSLLNLIQSSLIFTITLVILNSPVNRHYKYYLMALLLSFLVIFITGSLIIFKTKNRTKLENSATIIRQSFRLGIKNQIGTILQQINSRISYLLLTPAAVGIFSNATSIGESTWLIAYSFSSILFGRISNENNEEKRIRLTLQFFKWTYALSIFACVVLLFIPDSFYAWLFGKEFIGIAEILVFQVPGLIAFASFIILGHYFSGKGEFEKNTIAILVGLSITCLGWLFIFIYNLEKNMFFIATLISVSSIGTVCTVMVLFKKHTGVLWKNFMLNKKDFHEFNSFFLTKDKSL